MDAVWRDILPEQRGWGLRVGPLGGGESAATVLVAATGAADGKLSCFRGRRVVAGMHGLTDAPRVGQRGRGCDRQRRRGKISHQRDEQQQSGGQAMHFPHVKPNPKDGASIEQNAKWVQAQGGPWPARAKSIYLPTMSPLRPEIAPRTSPFSFSGTLNLSSVATRCFTVALQSSSVMPRPVWAVFMSRPV